jgi:hypothetical protein
VRSAGEFIKELCPRGSEEMSPAIQMAVLNYSKLVLGCKRASALQDIINPISSSLSSGSEHQATGKDKKSKGGKPAKNADATAAIAESEREEMEERYERVILSVLVGLGSLVERQPENASRQYATNVAFADASSIVRLTQSSRGSFRRASYNLVGKFCQFAQSLVSPPTRSMQPSNFLSLATLIPSLVSAEKDPSNYVSLLELVLAYLSMHKATNSSPWEAMDASAFTKSLSKSLRRGCCGAPATCWGPMILPILASLPCDVMKEGEKTNQPLPLVVVESLWEGRKSAVGIVDSAATVSSVAECVTYLMLRRPKDSSVPFTPESMNVCGNLFLDSVSYYLNDVPYSDELCITISRDINRLDAASVDDGTDDRVITHIKSSLWGSAGMQRTLLSAKREKQSDLKLTNLIGNIISNAQNKDDFSSHLKPSARALFADIIAHSDKRTNKSCTKEEVELILNIIQFCGAQMLFPAETEELTISVEDFCVNNLIRWILIHSRSVSTAIASDFNILKYLLLSIHSIHQQKQIWGTVLRELINSYCDVTTLAIGLCAMATDIDGQSFADMIRCQILDEFAIETSDRFINKFWQSHDLSHRIDENDGPVLHHQGDFSLFFRTCLGISDCKSILVSTAVIKHWIDNCSGKSKYDRLILEDEEGSNALLQTMLELGSVTNGQTLTRQEVSELLIESWREGGPIWKQSCHSYHLVEEFGKESIRKDIVSTASSLLREDIRRDPPSDHATMELTCQAWAIKASRLIEISKCSLQDVGIDSELCKVRKSAEFLFISIMYLLHSIDSPGRCRELLICDKENQTLFVQILSSVTESERAPLLSFQQLTARMSELVDALGGAAELVDVAQSCPLLCVDLLATYMRQPDKDKELCQRTLTALSYLVAVLFPTKFQERSDKDDSVLAENIQEGDSLWYEKAEGTRVKAAILKVHTEDFPHLYFTIKEENAQEERQTVSSRLKRNPTAFPEIISRQDDEDSRDYLGRYIMDNLVKPFDTTLRNHLTSLQTEISAECINIILSQIGTVSVGIGSVRYEIAQTVSSLERKLLELLPNATQHFYEASLLLRCISLAMGYGIFSKASAGGNFMDLKLSPDQIFTTLSDIYGSSSLLLNEDTTLTDSINLSSAMWLAVAADEVKDGDLLRQISKIILSLCDVMIPASSAESSMALIKSIVAFQSSTKKCIDYSPSSSEIEPLVFEKIMRSFVDMQDPSDAWLEFFAFIVLHYTTEVPMIILNAAVAFSDSLWNCLKSPMKRWPAFQMLMSHAKETTPNSTREDVFIFPRVGPLLEQWKTPLDEEEAIDLEADVQVACMWLSESIINLLISIGQEIHPSCADEIPSNELTLGALLTWVLFLEIFDKAGSVDMRNRASICVFLQQTNALKAMMNLALQEADLDVGRKHDVFKCVSAERKGEFVLKDIATLAVFRSIESLPTLVKSWFNDDCPRYLQQKLVTFVENKVAPETLQRELFRIKDATSFGEMSVNGSAVSREVVAIYHQDECQLSVTIRVPATFPLRNVEVDCQKTLGIAEKRWRRWALNIMMMLNNQDGSILDALLLWKENVDKEFEGVEPCPVCMSVLCLKTHSMPNLQCKTCNNRFHSQCLHKWFQSSGKSNCVLCQQPWSGTKVA